MSQKDTFLKKLGQTGPTPYLIEVDHAEGLYIYDKRGKKYMDMIAGVAVNSIGNRHPKVVKAIKEQTDKYLHCMVWGEYIQDSNIEFANRLTAILPSTLNCVYPVNSGTEANEAALKLAKRFTGRTELVAFTGSYHGGTHGSMSVSANEKKKIPFRPLLPDVRFLRHNNLEDISQISEKTAGVIVETIQGDAGVRESTKEFLMALRNRCDETGTQLIFDEIQCGLGRTGNYFAFERSGVIPDILTLGKALGGGLPIGACVSSYNKLHEFTHDPILGHITTFGGHPLITASAAAFLDVLTSEIDLNEVERLGKLLADRIGANPEIKEVRRAGMMFAFDMESFERVEKVVNRCLEYGIISFWFLSHPYSFRLSPPLNITEEEIMQAGDIIIKSIEETRG